MKKKNIAKQSDHDFLVLSEAKLSLRFYIINSCANNMIT